MFTRKALVCALFAAGMLGAAAAPLPSGAATTEFDVQLNFGPPPPRQERIPNPRRGYVWSPGHWQWSRSAYRHVWVPGQWERARAGYVYREPRWVERDGRWHFQARRWDRDGDGVPNRLDPTPYGGVTVAPPPPRREVVPARRAGYAWSPGHWEWRAGRHVWVAGQWERVRAGYTYYAPRWVERSGRWYFEPRRWDRDGDGIPNRRDATPDGGRRGDRDKDGVPNRYDARPSNPNKY